ncbi:hypothetical protein PCANC_18909 [Puccinia coronata f. sp. avenae]|uniref:Uncharacterized protein n=1 Tax=Puccinia coronata f. sp. avenae TaxID=200324 RepID=A0A2N5SNJ9_9BASI|nr:hypothetical protein PCANC_18909 [Puccinia coronata f. sp. avenae]
MSLAKILVAFQLLHCLVQSRPLSSSPDLVKRGIGGVFHFGGTSTGLSKEGEAMEKSDDWISTLDQAASWLLGFNSHAREGVPVKKSRSGYSANSDVAPEDVLMLEFYQCQNSPMLI